MKSVIRIFALTLAFTSIAALAQAKDVEVKDSPALQVLVQLAKDHVANQKALDTKVQQARAALDQSNKSLTDQINAMRKSLEDDLQKDKKYKDRFNQITDMQKKLQENSSTALAALQKDAGALQQKVQMETAQIDGLVPVIRKENNLPDNATFDPSTQKWSVPEKK